MEEANSVIHLGFILVYAVIRELALFPPMKNKSVTLMANVE